ncbi:MAG TPA: hypothetical protein DEP23_11815 [Ruminococcaceae bacterium]|nr:hypothetical protein [Oscillospiraceae bacterium]
MSKKVFRTVAFQIDDLDFLEEYDQRQQDSGLSVKNYFISLIKADIAMHQTQKDSPVQDGLQTDTGTEQTAAQQKDEITAPEQDADEPSEDTAVTNDQGQTAGHQPGYENWSEPATPENAPDSPGVPSDDVNAYLPHQGQTDTPEEMMNLFVKITKEQREALEAHKLKTDETVSKVLNRIIDAFLDNTDTLPEGFEEAYKHYSDNIQFCDTKASAKIPSRVNQELTDYLNSFGGSRNALMASLIELELKDQELAETQNEDRGMNMM